MNGLLTDLYELTMAAGYFESGKAGDKASFEFTLRRLPANRNYAVIAGIPQVVDYLLNLSFAADEIAYLRGLPPFAKVSPGFFDYLRDFRFTGDLFAVPEGTLLFAGEPVLTIRAPIIEAQIPETYLLSAVTFQTLDRVQSGALHRRPPPDAPSWSSARAARTPPKRVRWARAPLISAAAPALATRSPDSATTFP